MEHSDHSLLMYPNNQRSGVCCQVQKTRPTAASAKLTSKSLQTATWGPGFCDMRRSSFSKVFRRAQNFFLSLAWRGMRIIIVGKPCECILSSRERHTDKLVSQGKPSTRTKTHDWMSSHRSSIPQNRSQIVRRR